MNSDIQPTDSKSDSPNLEEVRQRFESWRQRRKKRTGIPKSLWQAAAGLTGEYSISHLSKVLRVNYSALKNQVHKLSSPEPSKSYVSSATFLELPVQTPGLESTIEMIRADGAVMTMHLKGATGSDLLEIGKAFWKYGA